MALVSEDPDEDGVPVGTSTLVCVSSTVVNAVEVPEVKMTVPSEVNEDWNVTVVATAVVRTTVVVDVGAEDVSVGGELALEHEVVKSVAVAELDVTGTVMTTGTWIVVVPPAVHWLLTESTVLHELADKVPFDVGTQLTDWIVVTVGSSVDTLSLNDVETLSVVNVVNWVAVGDVMHDMVVEL
ncbi:hypothetical protein TRAPUB_12546 [Trametes pubescens]|uniref:Uncharacterized protein n=1 Tax=Trametes pubescens TaxID=154538 RepID=A0A1M2VTJ4_TRAPU|nr:hypothetical protein TRAPUB_12546 [Trametes pubescens]